LLRNGISDWLNVLLTEHLLNELLAGEHGTILSEGAHEAEVKEVADVLLSVDLLLKVWHWDVFGIVGVEP
jgi:hypothetical protein